MDRQTPLIMVVLPAGKGTCASEQDPSQQNGPSSCGLPEGSPATGHEKGPSCPWGVHDLTPTSSQPGSVTPAVSTLRPLQTNTGGDPKPSWGQDGMGSTVSISYPSKRPGQGTGGVDQEAPALPSWPRLLRWRQVPVTTESV
jgi:hypothetical protein